MADEPAARHRFDRPIFDRGGPDAEGAIRKRRRRISLQAKMFVFSLLAMAILVGVGAFYMRPQENRYVLDNYQVITVGTHDFRNLVLTSGRVVPEEIVQFTAPSFSQASTRIEVVRVHVHEGDEVAAGQVMIELASEALMDDLRRKESERSQAEIELAQARLQSAQEIMLKERELSQAILDHEAAEEHLALLRQLYERGGVSRKELENAEKAVAEREAQIQAAEQSLAITQQRGELSIRKAEHQLESLEKQLEALYEQEQGLTVRSDRDGRVLSVTVNPGKLVAQGAELVSIADLRRQYVDAAVTPSQALTIGPGMPALLRFGTYDVEAFVEHVAPAATATSEGSAVRLRLGLAPEMAEQIVPNTDVSVEIETGIRKGRYAVQRGPYFATGDASFVYVVSDDGLEARRRDVRFGAIDGSVIEIIDGLTPGERIIYSSYSAFRAYPTIELLPEGGRDVEWR